jgi:ketosteroid isomerase-like protein
MSPGDVSLDRRKQIQALIDGVNARDFEALATLPFDQEFEFRSAVAAIEGEVYTGGAEGLRKWADTVDAAFNGFHAEVLELHEVAEEQALVVLRVTGTAKASGFPLDERLAQVWTWRDSKLWRNAVYTDAREAFEAVGLGE